MKKIWLPIHVVLYASFCILHSSFFIPRGFAQTPKPAPPASVPDDSAQPDPLPGFPRPPDAPASLLEAPAPTPSYSCAHLPGPYFAPDPLLDPPELPLPGWVASMEAGAIVGHIKNRLTNPVQVGMRMPNTVQLPSAELDWSVSPRFEVGYRLPSGFGELAFAYRFLATEGTGTLEAPDGLAGLKSRLDVNQFDFDYVSREFSLWPRWDMKWRIGGRLASVFFDSHANEAFDVAAAGSGIFEQRTSNHYVGFGPHAGVELAHGLGDWGLALVGRADFASLLGRTRQRFVEVSTTRGPDGLPLAGESILANPQTVPMLNGQLGLSWRPPGFRDIELFLGYQYEYWWNVGRLSTANSRGELSDQGVLLRGELNF